MPDPKRRDTMGEPYTSREEAEWFHRMFGVSRDLAELHHQRHIAPIRWGTAEDGTEVPPIGLLPRDGVYDHRRKTYLDAPPLGPGMVDFLHAQDALPVMATNTFPTAIPKVSPGEALRNLRLAARRVDHDAMTGGGF